jgi:ABC-type multidrug transport system fused ATPase/permease subunit
MIVLVSMTLGFFWITILLCFIQVAVDDMKCLRQSLLDLGALIDTNESKQRLNVFLDIRESQNLEYWINLRATVYDNVRTSFTHGFAIPAGTTSVVLDLILVVILLWRIYISKVTLDIFNLLLIWDIIMVSAFILVFLLVVSRVNDAASQHVDKLNGIKFTMNQKVTQFLREQRVLADKLAQDDMRRRGKDDFFEREEKKIGEQRVAEKEQKEREDSERQAALAAQKKTLSIFKDEEASQDDSTIAELASVRQNDVLSRRMSVAMDNVNRRGWMEYQTALASNLMLESAVHQLNGQRHPLEVLGFVVNSAMVTRVTSLIVAAAASGIISLLSSWYSSHI